MTPSSVRSRKYSAADFGLTGSGDETRQFQKALDRLAAQGAAVLQLDAGRAYTVSTLTVRSAVTIRGDQTTLHSPAKSQAPGASLITAGAGANLTLEGLILHGPVLLHGKGHGVMRLNRCVLEPVAEDDHATAFVLADNAQLLARASRARSLAPNTQALVQNRAKLEWRGGDWLIINTYLYDRAMAVVDSQAPGQLLSPERRECTLHFGRPSGKYAGLRHWERGQTSGALWEALCGTPTEFKQVLHDPACAAALQAWQAHNATQCGRGQITLRNRPAEDTPVCYNVFTTGRFTVDIRNSVLQRVYSHDQAVVTMQGGRLRRCEAYALSQTTFKDVDLIMAGSDNPWHPTTAYCQGNHVMEFSQVFNDLLPTVIFQGGQMDFAGDDCLNGLPEARALQLMEVVHDLNSLFPNFTALEALAPETRQPGAPLTELKGQAGAVHDETTKPVMPFDFTNTGFTWQGDYQTAHAYRVGDVCAHDNILYVCNRAGAGATPNVAFNHWMAFHVAFRNEKGYIQVARRVCRDGRWQWERRQALGPWAGYTLRERGNPIVTYQVHLILRDTVVIRRANTWSFSISDVIPVGNSAYNYLLSSLVSNVSTNRNFNRVECYNVELRNAGEDAFPCIRGLSLGPNRHIPGRYVFKNVRIVGESIGAPIVFRIDAEPLRPDNTVVLTGVTAEYDQNLAKPVDYGEQRHPLNTPTGSQPTKPMQRAVPGDAFTLYEFIDQPPPDWRGIQDYLAHAIDTAASADFLKEHPGLVKSCSTPSRP